MPEDEVCLKRRLFSRVVVRGGFEHEERCVEQGDRFVVHEDWFVVHGDPFVVHVDWHGDQFVVHADQFVVWSASVTEIAGLGFRGHCLPPANMCNHNNCPLLVK